MFGGSRYVAVLVAVALAAGCGGAGKSSEPSPKRVFRHFHSRPDLSPPTIEVNTPAKGTAPGYIFVGPKKKVKQRGPLILTNDGDVVWFKQVEPREATDFKVPEYEGKPVLTWWEGKSDFGIGQGFGVIYDNSYRKIAEVHAGHGLDSDLHEFRLTDHDTALLTIYHAVPRDLRKFGGPKKGMVEDGVVQEVDVKSGKVLFEWHSLDHVALAEGYAPIRTAKVKGKKVTPPWDYFHPNSVWLDSDGNYVISARNTRALYKVSKADGHIIWRLGGKKSDFKMGPGTTFAWQHDAELHPHGKLTLFDNESMPKVGDHSRALVLKVDTKAMTVKLEKAYVHPDKLLAPHQGNFELLADGHAFVGWGGIPYVTEFDENGKVLYDAHMSSSIDSYRWYRFEWHGKPAQPPRVALGPTRNGHVTVWVSWNGATDVDRWQVLAGSSRKDLKQVREADKLGFETQISVKTKARWIEVKALDASGKTLGTSKPVERS